MFITITGRAAKFLELDAESFTPIKSRARVTDLSEYRNRDRKRSIPRDLRWQLGGDVA